MLFVIKTVTHSWNRPPEWRFPVSWTSLGDFLPNLTFPKAGLSTALGCRQRSGAYGEGLRSHQLRQHPIPCPLNFSAQVVRSDREGRSGPGGKVMPRAVFGGVSHCLLVQGHGSQFWVQHYPSTEIRRPRLRKPGGC